MHGCITRRAPNPERYLELVARQIAVDFGRMVAADNATSALVALFSVVGHIDYDSLLALESLANLVNNRVVIQASIVVVSQQAALLCCQFGSALSIVFWFEMLFAVRTTCAIVQMLTQQMKNGESRFGITAFFLLSLLFLPHLIIIGQQTLIEDVCTLVAMVEHCSGKVGVVQEKSAREVVNCLFSFRQELVGQECHIVACLAKYFGKERIVAPLALLPHHMHGEKALEHETRQVPRCHNIGERHKQSCVFTLNLTRRCWHKVTVLL